MSRVKRGNVARKRRKAVLKQAKGFRGSLSKLFRQANQAVMHALVNKYRDRRNRKRDFRALWITRINAALKNEISYSKFTGLLNKKNVELNRKMLSEIAISNPEVFDDIVKFVKK
ncbi:MAG: 50S ribosomal protein L20 [bacterium]|nr:50S ribosomal protein L20 [bacterium]